MSCSFWHFSEKLKEFDMEAVPYESPFFLLIALLKHIQVKKVFFLLLKVEAY